MDCRSKLRILVVAIAAFVFDSNTLATTIGAGFRQGEKSLLKSNFPNPVTSSTTILASAWFGTAARASFASHFLGNHYFFFTTKSSFSETNV